MEDSDDNLSFVSASDSETPDEATPRLNRAKAELPRACSPAPSLVSRASFRRLGPKRPAPQPPVLQKPPPEETATSESPGASPPEMSVGAFASHPVHLVSPEAMATTTASSPEDSKPLPEPRGWSLTNLQLRHIDDVLEPLSQSLPLSHPDTSSSSLPFNPLNSSPVTSRTPFGPSVISSMASFASPPSYPIPGAATSGSLSHLYPSFPPQSLSTNASSFYLPSMQPSCVPSQESPFGGSPHYAPVTPLSYLPHLMGTQPPPSPPHNFFGASFTPPGSQGGGAPRNEALLRNPLLHSASDPGVNQMLRSGFLMPPAAGASLDRLSEAEENDDEDSYEEVFYRQEEATGARNLVPVKAKGRRRLERSDSVGVAHIYEDLLVSSRLNLKVTFTNLTMVVMGLAFLMPNSATILYNFFRLVFGTLFPAYYSYKAVRTKNVKEYVKWMMYWIVFAFFTCAETITDVFVSFWFPFYYEIKILVVLWLLSPATRGSSILYRKFVHPWLTKREEEIDDCIAKAKQQGYTTVVQLGTKGVNYATSVIMQTALKGGGGLVSQLKRSYSASEIGEDTADHNRNVKALPQKESIQSPSEEDDVSISSGQDPPLTRAALRARLSSPVPCDEML